MVVFYGELFELTRRFTKIIVPFYIGINILTRFYHLISEENHMTRVRGPNVLYIWKAIASTHTAFHRLSVKEDETKKSTANYLSASEPRYFLWVPSEEAQKSLNFYQVFQDSALYHLNAIPWLPNTPSRTKSSADLHTPTQRL